MKTELSKQPEATLAARRNLHVRPDYRVEEQEHAYRVLVYLPGVSRGDASITLEKDVLTVEARRAQLRDDRWQVVHREIPEADFRLQLQLNVKIEESKITAHSDNGVLTVNLPIAEALKPRTIAIE